MRKSVCFRDAALKSVVNQWAVEQLESRRLLAAASLDTSFDGDGRLTFPGAASTRIADVVVQSDGKILALAKAVSSQAGDGYALYRFNINGSIDASYGGGDGWVPLPFLATTGVFDLKLDGSGRAVVSGSSAITSYVIARFTTAGQSDQSFNGTGSLSVGNAPYNTHIGVRPDGKILVVRSIGQTAGSNEEIVVTQLSVGGEIDRTYGVNGSASIPFATTNGTVINVAVTPGGKLLATGSDDDGGLYVARFTAAGEPDATFGTGGMKAGVFADYMGTEIAVLPDDSFYVTANYQPLDPFVSPDASRIVRFTSAGALDSTFGSPGQTGYVQTAQTIQLADIAVQSDGKMIVAGYGQDDTDFVVAQYVPAGNVDTAFGGDGYATFNIQGNDSGVWLDLAPDGRVVIAGTSNSGASNALIRLESDAGLAQQPDGSFLLNGTGDDDTISVTPAAVGGGLFNIVLATPTVVKTQRALLNDKLVIKSGDGHDKINLYGQMNFLFDVDSGDGDDTIDADEATGFVYEATLNGGAGNDLLRAPDKRATLLGGSGDDAILAINTHPDFIDGGADDDYAQAEPADQVVNTETYDNASIRGVLFNDVNGNGVQDSGETRLEGRSVYLDNNNNGTHEGAEPYAIIEPQGVYLFVGLTGGQTYVVRQVVPSGWEQTTPAQNAAWNIPLALHEQAANKNFGSRVSPQTPFNGSPFAIGASPVMLQAEDFDLGGEGVAYHDTTANNIGGKYRTSEAVDIKTIAGTSNQFRISDAIEGESLEYTIDVAEAGQYIVDFRVGNRDPGSSFHLELQDLGGFNDITGELSVPDTNSFDTFATVSRFVTLPAGRHVLRFVFDSPGSSGYGAAFDWMKISPPPPTNQSLVVSPTYVNVPENSKTGFTVRLAAQPLEDVIVDIDRVTSGDLDLVSDKSSLTFTPDNWSVAQSVFISALNDSDSTNGQAGFRVSTPNLAGHVVAATEIDDDTAPSGQQPFYGTPFNVDSDGVTIEAEDFDKGGEGIAYHDTTASNIGNTYRQTEAVDIKKIPETLDSYRISDAKTGEWLEYTINVQQAGEYVLGFRVGNRDPGSSFHAELVGTSINLTGELSVPDTNSFDNFTTVSVTRTLPQGTHVLRFTFDDPGSSGYGAAFDSFRIEPATTQPPVDPQQPFHGTPFNIGVSPVTIQAESFDTGGEGIAYHDTTSSNIGNRYRTSEAVDIKNIAGTTSNEYRISDAIEGEWLEYTIDVQQSGQYVLDFRVGNRDPGSGFHVELRDGASPVNLTGAMSVPDTNGFDSFTTISKTATLSAGKQVLRFVFDSPGASGYGAAFDWMRLTRV